MKAPKEFLLIVFMSLLSVSGVSAATITGTVKFDGDAPKFDAIQMAADPICLTHHTDAVYPETLVLGEGKTMANVFVYVKGGLAKKDYPAPAEAAQIDQQGCQYHPHISGVMVGQTVKILNPDGTLHNVHALSKVNEEFNLAMPKFRKEVEQVWTKEEFMFPIKCDVHSWMTGYIAIMSHPFFSTTKTDGTFTISNLEPGTYEIEAWHEKLGTKTESVTIGSADETKTVDFTFSRPAKQ